tara:strand:+ start:997 stop:2190 length:1194 start_codon:yes stop_codon:yes gene_type:complete
MSNLLERAIIDAKALKEAALKNAEQLVIEKYSSEVKQAVDRILEEETQVNEQDDALTDLFGDDQAAMGLDQAEISEDETDSFISADDLESNLPDAFASDDDELIQIKLDSLDSDLEDEDDGVFAGDDEYEDDEIGIDLEGEDDFESEFGSDMDADVGLDMDAGDIGLDVTSDSPMSTAALEEIIADALKEVLNEEEELDEEVDLDELMERVRVEGEPQKSGWAGTPESIMREYESMLLAREQDSEVKEKNAELRKMVAELQKENKTISSAALKLQEQNKNFNTTFKTMQKKLETMNVSNAKLLYINQALENASLNERQKKKLVEAISKAGTVQEAKIIFDTMNESVSTTSDVKKQATLNEMVSRKSSLLVAARKEQTQQDANPMFNRMQKLAGIKTK